MIEIKAPESIPLKDKDKLIFLAGSIEMGEAEKWQEKVVKELEEYDIIILNPRRDNWDKTLEQKNNPEFKKQVNWELTAQENAKIIVMYFDPNTKSPITLLELGLFKDKNLVVCCPDGFWKKGNIDLVCERYRIPQVNTLEKLINGIKSLYKKNEINNEKTT